MEILGIIIFIIIMISSSSKKQNEQNKSQTNPARENTSTGSQYRSTNPSEEKPWETAARNNIERAAKRAMSVANRALNEIFMDEGTQMTMDLEGEKSSSSKTAFAKPEAENDISAAEQIRKRRLENRHSSILERAIDNADEQKEDVTLNTMEAEHNHSERVTPAKHHHPEDVIPENMLGSVEDLMIKGYDGNLCFERDFVGEAMDMISRFTVPSDIPEFSNQEAS